MKVASLCVCYVLRDVDMACVACVVGTVQGRGQRSSKNAKSWQMNFSALEICCRFSAIVSYTPVTMPPRWSRRALYAELPWLLYNLQVLLYSLKPANTCPDTCPPPSLLLYSGTRLYRDGKSTE
jgi:hypothetical protein